MISGKYPRIFFIGIAAIIVSIIVSIISPGYALIPLVLFVIISMVSPFFPGLQMFLPCILRGTPDSHGVALTFDDGPDPASTPLIIEMLKIHGIEAHFFVVGRKAAAHPELIRLILDSGHTLGNHTMNHDTLIMLKTESRLNKEISSCQDVLMGFGITAYSDLQPASSIRSLVLYFTVWAFIA